MRPRITEAIRESARVTLKGNTHPLAVARYDRGAVADNFSVDRALLLLKRSDEQQTALESYLEETHTPGSAHYHQWLTPAKFGALYGPADSDVQAVVAWLQSHGLRVNKVAQSKSAIEFSGSEAQLQEAFHTTIHSYSVNGELHHANATDPEIPAALAPVIAGLTPLHDFEPVPHLHTVGQANYSAETHKATPLWSYPKTATSEIFAVAPGDFAVQYNLNPLYSAGIDGAGQTIGIISASNIDIGVASTYRALFGLLANPPQVIIDGSDPGQTSAVTEAYLDVEVAGSVAPKATINLYTAASTATESGLYLAAIRAVEDNAASVLSLSYGSCESRLGSSGNSFWNTLWQQAAAQGQTVLVSAGDGGPAGCDNFNVSGIGAGLGLAVSGFASTPWNIAVGGTDFYYTNYAQPNSAAFTTELSSYWKLATSTTPAVSLQQVIPEQPWNNSSYGLNASTLYSGVVTIVGGSGGASSKVNYSSTTGLYTGYAKPSWQVGTGVPQDGVRDLPDVSLFAANGANYSVYPICANSTDCSTALSTTGATVITGVGGTSASAPAMAGIMALVNQKYGAQGQANYVLYPLAAQFPAAFHDVTVGGNNVPCLSGTPDCALGTNGLYSFGKYSATAGYDLASGLGSVDANQLVSNWNKVSFKTTTTALSVSPTTLTHGASATLAAQVSASGGTPTGVVTFGPTGYVPGESSTVTFQDTNGNEVVVAGASSQATLDAAGKAQISTTMLPGGTYTVQASYAGDGTYSASKSATTQITVSPENSQVYLQASGLAMATLSGTANTYRYGTATTLDAVPLSSSITNFGSSSSSTSVTLTGLSGRATGTVTFTDATGNLSSTIPVGADGHAFWNPGALAVGTHSVTAGYSGDASYNASKSTPLNLTITTGLPLALIRALPAVSTQAGGVTVSIEFSTIAGATPPTGNITLTLTPVYSGGAPVSLTVGLNTGTSMTGLPYSFGAATFHSLPIGTYSFSYHYAGDSNWVGVLGGSSGSLQVVSNGAQTVSNTTLTASPTSVSSGGTLTLTATVKSGGAATTTPTGLVVFYADGGSTLLGTATVSSSGTAALPLSTKALSSGIYNFVAQYSGDGTYMPSSSSTASAQVMGVGDFQLNAPNPTLTVKSGSTGTLTLNLAGMKGFSGAVALSCTPSSSAISCSPSAATTTLGTSGATATITVNTQTQVTKTSTNSRPSWPLDAMGTLTALALLGMPARRRSWKTLLSACFGFVLLCGLGACAGGGAASTTSPTSGSGGGTTTTTQNAPAGTYSILVTGQANGLTHNVKLTVVVQ